MVDHIDLKTLNLEELTGVVNIYPWFGVARKELCVRMQQMDALSDTLLSQTALHIGSRRILYDLQHGRPGRFDAVDMTRPSAPVQHEAVAETVQQPERKVFIAGGDYFSQAQYNDVKRGDDNIFSSFATRARAEGYVEPEGLSNEEFCTETLAQIYLEQGYLAEAKKIYSKLSLRYPEKSVYFAALIDEINKN